MRRIIQTFVLVPSAIVCGIVWMFILSAYIGTPPVIEYRWINPETTAYMREAKSQTIQHRWVSSSKISPYLKKAVVASEDDLFYTHHGIDWTALRRAAKTNLKRERYSHGGSTITMQLARNLFLSPRKSLIRKSREILIALELELWLSKERILGDVSQRCGMGQRHIRRPCRFPTLL